MEPPEGEPDSFEQEPEAHAEPRAVDRWRQNTASEAITAALALGLQQVFQPQRSDTVGIEQEAPAKPVDPDRVEVRFDPQSSRGTVVVIHRGDGEKGSADTPSS